MLVHLEMPVVLARQAVEGRRLADVLLDPVGEAPTAAFPALEPGRQGLAAGLGEVASIIEPAQLL